MGLEARAMDSFEYNKVAGGILATALVVMALGIIGESIYAPATPAKPGFVIAVAEPTATGSDTAAPVVVAPIEARMQTASADAGAKVATKCKTCHSFDPSGARGPAGPNLYNVLGGPAAHMAGFPYSDAMQKRRASGALWTYADVDKFITNPKAFVPGTFMTFQGLPSPTDRANVIAYLRSLSPSPIPLPAAPAPAPAASAAPAANAPAATPAPAAAPAPEATPAPAQ
jgi:cytochrome c